MAAIGGGEFPAAAPARDGVRDDDAEGARGGSLDLAIRNATEGAWYTVYESAAVDGGYRAAASVQSPADGLLPLAVDAAAATKFVRVGVSDQRIPAGTALP